MGMYLGGQKVSPIIKSGAEINNQDKTITENGTYTADAGYTGLGEVTVNVPPEQPVITELNVTPTTSAQTINPPSGVHGHAPVKVAAVTSSIDNNIIAGNIKKNVQILGVTGTLEEGITPAGTIPITENGIVDVTNYASASVSVPSEQPVITELNVTPTTSAQTIVAPSGTDGYSPINVGAVTSSIDNNITAGNIKSGVSILGVTGNVVELKGETRTITPTTSQQVITPSSGKNGITQATVGAVTSSIDNNIVAENIKKDVQILGVTGTVEELNGETKVITPTTSQQVITPSSGKNAITQATVAAVTSSIDNNIIAGNIKKNVSILGVTGILEEGITPTGTINITENGTVDVTNYASAEVNVSGSGSFIGLQREVSANGVYQKPATSFTFSLPNNATNVGNYAMQYAFDGCTGLTSADLSSLTTVSGNNAMQYAFRSCTGLTSADLSSLTTVSSGYAMCHAFSYCEGLTSVDLSSLTTVSGGYAMQNAFYDCTGLTSADLSSLTTVSGNNAMQNAFSSCTGLTSADLSSLTTVSGTGAMSKAFESCLNLTSVDLSSLTTVSGVQAMQNAFSSCTALTSVLFTNLETIGANTSSNNYGQFAGCFQNCNNLTSITFPKLEKIYCTGGSTASYGTFTSNNKVQKMYFPKLDTITYGSGASTSNQNACKNVFYGCSALTELHFAAANQAAIEASPGYSTAWGRGAGNVTIYFDL